MDSTLPPAPCVAQCIPPEVLERIFGFLGRPTPLPSLVCVAWANEAQRALFATLKVEYQRDVDRLLASLEGSRRGEQVRELRLSGATAESTYGLLARMPNLSILFICPSFRRFSPNRSSTLRRSTMFPLLVKLTLQTNEDDLNREMFQDLVASAPLLSDLTVSGAAAREGPDHKPYPWTVAAVPKLRKLRIMNDLAGSEFRCGGILKVNHFSGLEELELGGHNPAMASMATDFYRVIGPTLRSLRLASSTSRVLVGNWHYFTALESLQMGSIDALDLDFFLLLPTSVTSLTLEKDDHLPLSLQTLARNQPRKLALQSLSLRFFTADLPWPFFPPLKSLSLGSLRFGTLNTTKAFCETFRNVVVGELAIERLSLAGTLWKDAGEIQGHCELLGVELACS